MTGIEIAFRIFVALPLGLVFGSFLTVAIHRIPAGGSVSKPRSRCPNCGTQLRNVDNIPVVSWLLLRGRCHTCGVPISPVYPLTELACGVSFVAVALFEEDAWVAALFAPFLALLVAISIIDLRHRKIPNRLVYPALVVAAVFVVVADLAGSTLEAPRAAVGFLAYGVGLLVVALISPRGMGMGDVKLAALIGLVCGGIGLRYVGVAAGVGILIGGIAAIIALASGAGRKSALPFGPFLAAGAAVAIFAGGPIADAYLKLLH
jgi:leader peptidase (prepilin peptidase) / N-methyltransferase